MVWLTRIDLFFTRRTSEWSVHDSPTTVSVNFVLAQLTLLEVNHKLNSVGQEGQLRELILNWGDDPRCEMMTQMRETKVAVMATNLCDTSVMIPLPAWECLRGCSWWRRPCGVWDPLSPAPQPETSSPPVDMWSWDPSKRSSAFGVDSKSKWHTSRGVVSPDL